MTIDAPETVVVDTKKVACDGDTAKGEALGHPRVYLTMDHDMVECPYCDRRYVLAGSDAAKAAS